MINAAQPNATRPSSPGYAVKRFYTIGDLAREFDVTHRALRFYEDRGLVTPQRDGTARHYSPQDRARVSLIVRAKALGFTLAEIKQIVAQEGHGDAQPGLSLSFAQVEEQIGHLEVQRAEVEGTLAELKGLRLDRLQAA